MTIKIKKHWEDLETFEAPVIDKRGDVFEYNGEPWVMILRPPHADQVKEAVRKNAAEASSWRERQPASLRNSELPDTMSERHMVRIIQASHVGWKNAPVEDGSSAVDFSGDDFAEFLKEEPWYVAQWQKVWTNAKNSTRLKGGQPKKTSSNGAKPK